MTSTDRQIIRTVPALSLGAGVRYEMVRYTIPGRKGTAWELVRSGETGLRMILAQTEYLPRKAPREVEFKAGPWGLSMGIAPRWTMTADDLS